MQVDKFLRACVRLRRGSKDCIVNSGLTRTNSDLDVDLDLQDGPHEVHRVTECQVSWFEVKFVTEQVSPEWVKPDLNEEIGKIGSELVG